MDFLTSLLDIGTGGIFGAITGVIGGISSAIANYKMKKLEFQHEKDMAEADRQMLKTEAECAVDLERARADTVEREYDGAAYAESVKQATRPLFKASYMDTLMDGNAFMRFCGGLLALLMGVTDTIRYMMRSVITTYFMWQMHLLVVAKDKNAMQAVPLLATSCVTWWFADRATRKIINKVTAR